MTEIWLVREALLLHRLVHNANQCILFIFIQPRYSRVVRRMAIETQYEKSNTYNNNNNRNTLLGEEAFISARNFSGAVLEGGRKCTAEAYFDRIAYPIFLCVYNCIFSYGKWKEIHGYVFHWIDKSNDRKTTSTTTAQQRFKNTQQTDEK